MPPYKIIKKQSKTPSQPQSRQSELAIDPEIESKKKDVYDRLISSQTNREQETVNSQYFDHIGGKCLCALCNCGKHKCNGQYCSHKPTLHGNQSVYQREFIRKTPENFQSINKNYFQEPKAEGDIGNVSTYKHDFPGYNSKADFAKNQQKPTVSGVAFSGMSTYNNMYLNWGMGDTPQLMPQNNPTVIKDMPFMGRSVYRDSYQGTHVPPAQSTKNLGKSQKSPLSPPDLRFQAESIQKTSYQPFRTERQPLAKNQDKAELNPSYNGQYNTEYHKEFDGKSSKPCPAKEVIDSVSRYTGN